MIEWKYVDFGKIKISGHFEDQMSQASKDSTAYRPHIDPISKQELLYSKKSENIARDISIYLVRRLCCRPLPNVGIEFGINNYSNVSSVVQRLKRRIERDRTLQKELRIIEKKAKKSQGRT